MAMADGADVVRDFHCLRMFCDRITPDTPFSNFVLKITLALLNIPSFSETMMNCGQMEWKKANELDAFNWKWSKQIES